MVSHAPSTATPRCRGIMLVTASWTAGDAIMVLPTNRLSVSPTAMGRTAVLAPGFLSGISFAPQRKGAASAGSVPLSAVMQNSSRAF